MSYFFAVLSGIIAVLTGGCTLMVMADGQWIDAALVIGGIPFAISLAIFFWSMHFVKKRRAAAETKED